MQSWIGELRFLGGILALLEDWVREGRIKKKGRTSRNDRWAFAWEEREGPGSVGAIAILDMISIVWKEKSRGLI